LAGRKKNEQIEKALSMIAGLKKTYSVTNSSVADQFGISYTMLMRWKRRLSTGKPAVAKPGPKKVEPLDLGQLKRKIRDLDHRENRSQGTGRLHDAFNDEISRRELDRMVRTVRDENRRHRTKQKCQIA
jgi:hypothetical protein